MMKLVVLIWIVMKMKELDFESEDNSGGESEEIQFFYNDEFDELYQL